MATKTSLPLRELEALSRSWLPVLLAFLHPRIASQKSCLLQNLAKFCAEIDKSTRNAVLYGSRLSVHSATMDVDKEIKLIQRVGSLQRLLHEHPVGFIEEVLL